MTDDKEPTPDDVMKEYSERIDTMMRLKNGSTSSVRAKAWRQVRKKYGDELCSRAKHGGSE